LKQGKDREDSEEPSANFCGSPAHTGRAGPHLFTAFERWFKKLKPTALGCHFMLLIWPDKISQENGENGISDSQMATVC